MNVNLAVIAVKVTTYVTTCNYLLLILQQSHENENYRYRRRFVN